MALKLNIRENKVRLKVSSDSFTLKASEGTPIYPNTYTGATRVTPSSEEQVLQTGGLYVTEHIHIDPIPNNYGLITWNGSTLTVS